MSIFRRAAEVAQPYSYNGPEVNQGDDALPVMFRPGEYDYQTTLDPYNINMHLNYGPMSIYNDDRTIPEESRQTFTGWYFQPKIEGATISLFEGESIVMYVQIHDPENEGNYESWSCNTDYQMINTEYVGQIYNYNYGNMKLDNDAVERDVQNVRDQTVDHENHTRNGPWMAVNALKWYTQEYNIEENKSAVTCTAIRQYGPGFRGFFDMPAGSTVTVDMGFRVYDDASQTRARIYRDYVGVTFDLLPEDVLIEAEAGASFLSTVGTLFVSVYLLLNF